MKRASILILAILFFGSLCVAQSAVFKPAEESENHPFGFAGPFPPDDFNKIKELGVKYIRTTITWGKIETSDNSFVFQKPQRGKENKYDIVTNRYGLEPIVRLKFGQCWATKCDTINLSCPPGRRYGCPDESADCPPKDLGGWGKYGYSPLLYDFVYKTLEYSFRSNRPINFIVVGNEVNTLVFWHGTAEEYLKTRATVYKAVKDFNAAFGQDIKVVDNGIAGKVWGAALMKELYCSGRKEEALEFAQRYLRNISYMPNEEEARKRCNQDGRQYLLLKAMFKKDPNLGEPSFDYMSYHFYEPWDTQEEIINWIKEEMRKNGYQRPIMNTEGGFNDRKRSYSDTPGLAGEVADDVIKLHVVALANGVKTWLWLPFTERYEQRHFGAQWKGLVLPDQSKLPAFTAYKVMVQKLDGFTTAERLSGFSTEYVYKFVVKDTPIYVLWSKKPVTIDFQSELPGQLKVTKVDMTSEIAKSSQLRLTESPIFVERQ
jgi:hypothetical protein